MFWVMLNKLEYLVNNLQILQIINVYKPASILIKLDLIIQR